MVGYQSGGVEEGEKGPFFKKKKGGTPTKKKKEGKRKKGRHLHTEILGQISTTMAGGTRTGQPQTGGGS